MTHRPPVGTALPARGRDVAIVTTQRAITSLNCEGRQTSYLLLWRDGDVGKRPSGTYINPSMEACVPRFPFDWPFAILLLAFGCSPIGAAQPPAIEKVASTGTNNKQLYERAAKAIANNDPSAAIESLEQIVRDGDSSLIAKIAVVHLAECYIQTDRLESACEKLDTWSERILRDESAIKVVPDLLHHHARVWLQAGQGLTMNNASIAALEKLVAHIEKCPTDEALDTVKNQAQVELIKRSIASGDLDSAVARLDRVSIEGRSMGDDLLLIHAMILQKLGKRDQAKEAFLNLVERGTTALAPATARLELAVDCIQTGDMDKAETWLAPLRKSLDEAKLAGTRLHDIDFECRFRLTYAECALARGIPNAALEVLPTDEELDAFKPTQRVALRFARAEAAARARQQSMAMMDLEWLSEEAKRASPEPQWAATVELRRCELLLATRDFAKLQEVASMGKSRFPDFAQRDEFDYLLARAAMLQIDFDSARTYLNCVISAKPAVKRPAVARAHWMVGETYFLEQQYEPAIKAYRAAAAMDQQPWQSLSQLQTGKCLELTNQQQQAVAIYEQLIASTIDEKLKAEATARLDAVQRTAQSPKPTQRR